MMLHTLILTMSLLVPAQTAADVPKGLRTTAERSDFKSTAKGSEVDLLCRKLAEASRLVNLTEIGKTSEGRPITTLIVADPPLKTPAEALRSEKLVVFLLGNIHAGEVDGKEALPMLVRDLVSSPGFGCACWFISSAGILD